MAELELKKTLTKPAKRITIVRTNDDVQFFGINGRQLSAGMQGLHLNWDAVAGVVVVTSENFPGKDKWLFPANISHIEWSSVEDG